MSGTERPAYGFDAPDFTCNTLVGGAVAIGVGLARLDRRGGIGAALGVLILLAGMLPLIPGLCMFAYGPRGEFRLPDWMPAMVPWRGGERVPDVGIGRGLLLIGAAKRLTIGTVTGIDIWRTEELSGNVRTKTLSDAALEGVADRIEVVGADIRGTDFPDATFDVVLSLMCLHDMADTDGRRAACRELVRVLKPGGRVVVSDDIPSGEYARTLADAGLRIDGPRADFADALGLMWIVGAQRPLRRSDRFCSRLPRENRARVVPSSCRGPFFGDGLLPAAADRTCWGIERFDMRVPTI